VVEKLVDKVLKDDPNTVRSFKNLKREILLIVISVARYIFFSNNHDLFTTMTESKKERF